SARPRRRRLARGEEKGLRRLLQRLPEEEGQRPEALALRTLPDLDGQVGRREEEPEDRLRGLLQSARQRQDRHRILPLRRRRRRSEARRRHLAPGAARAAPPPRAPPIPPKR